MEDPRNAALLSSSGVPEAQLGRDSPRWGMVALVHLLLCRRGLLVPGAEAPEIGEPVSGARVGGGRSSRLYSIFFRYLFSKTSGFEVSTHLS